MKKLVSLALGILFLVPGKALALSEITPPPISAEATTSLDISDSQVVLSDDGTITLRQEPSILQVGSPNFTKKSSPTAVKPRRASDASLNDFLGTWIQRNISAYSGDEVTPTIKIYQADGEIFVDNLYNLGVPVKATWNESDGTLSIVPQTLYTHATYGACTINTWTLEGSHVVYNTTDPIKVSLATDGSLQFSQWGLFVSEGNSAGAAFDAYYSSTAQKPNGSFHTVSFDSTPVDTTYSVLVYQPDESKVAIANFLGNGKPYYITLGAESSAYMLPQLVMTLNIYGDFYLYAANSSSGAINKNSYITVSQNEDGTWNIGPWGVYCMASTSIIASTGKTNTLTTDFKFTFPTAGDNPMSGSGTESDPYLVKSLADFRYIALTTTASNSYAGSYFKLDNDINASASTDPYYVIGATSTNPFKGSFDGNGKTISYLTVDFGGNFYAGLFGNVGDGGTIKNLNLSNITFSGSGKYLGGVAGYTTADITNCTVSGTIDATNQEIGGVVGYTKGSVSECSFSGNIYGGVDVGGIIGYAYTSASIDNCQSTANLYVQYSVPYTTVSTHAMGGIVAASYGTTSKLIKINNCWFSGVVADLRGIDHIGGIAGYVYSTDMTECFNTGYIISRASTYVDGASAAAGGLSGYVSRGTYSDCYNAGTVSAPNTEFAGGLMGYGGGASTYEVSFKNCYTSGMINTKSQYEKVGVTGSYFSKAKLTIDNCYYDFQTTGLDTIAEGWISTANLTSGTLPAGFDASKWTATAGLYPQLKSMEGLGVANLAASPFFLSDNEIIGKIRKDFKVSTANGVNWGILQSDNKVIAKSEGVTIADGNVTLNNVYASESLVAFISDGSYKLYTIRLVPKIFQGDGSEQNPYLIQNKDELLTLQDAVNLHGQSHKGDYFTLTNDIDLANESKFIGIAGDGSGSTSFAGIFDGSNHTIHNFNLQNVVFASDGNISSSDSRNFSGFFGILDNTGVVKNLNIASDCSFSFYKYSAPVVGYALGKVYNCKNYADVKAYGSYCGGVVGVALDNAEISGCLNTGSITAADGMTGGIVGYSTALVTNSFNAGNVTAPTNSSDCANIGGVVGGSYGTISYCGNNAQITGSASLGGIVGGSAKSSSTLTGGNVIGCINTGIVSGSATASNGAIIGNRASYNDIADNYYDSQLSPNGGVGGGDVTGVTGVLTKEFINGSAPKEIADYWTYTASKYPINTIFADDEVANARRSIILKLEDVDCVNSMENQASLYGENTTWSLKEGKDFSIADGKLSINITSGDTAEDVLTANLNSYTKSYSLVALKALFAGKGTESDPHIIASIADMNSLANAVNNLGRAYAGHYFKLTENLDYTDTAFTPIATDSITFNGNFLGNEKTISNITYGSTSEDKYIGLFRRVGAAGSISDLTLKSTSFSGNSFVGSFAGEFAGDMTNCVNEGTVTTGGNYAGGLAGYFTESSTATNCVNKGVVTASKGSYIGGLAGVFYGAAVKCSNVAAVNGYTTYVGGLAGSLRGSLDECFNSGNVTSTSGGNYVGGLVAVVEAGTTINNCYNSGNITGAKSYAGGLYGGSITLTTAIKENGAIVTNSYNTGTITGTSSNIAGIAGLIAPGHHVIDCYNSGEINAGAGTVGGIVAETRGVADYTTTVERCYNYGTVNMTGSAKQGIGGIVGKLAANSNISNCGNAADVVTKGYFVGGIVGNQIGNIADCWNSGNITGDNYAIAGIAGYCGTSTTIDRCFNSGNVKATAKSTKAYGTVAGICGYGYGVISDCVNTGNLEGYLLMGGIAGTKLGSNFDIIRCYNTGKITIADGVTTVGNIFSSSVKFTGPNYYDSSVNGSYSTDANATGLTTDKLMELNLGETFVNPVASLPVQVGFQDVVDVRFPTARYLLSEGDTETNVQNDFKVATCEGMTWSASDTDLAQIQDGNVILADATDKPLTLTLTYGNKTKSFDFVINKKSSGINDIFANPVVSRRYYDLRGIEVVNPSAGAIYIVKTVYQDGSSTTIKEAF